METKINFDMAKCIIKKLNFPLFDEVTPLGFTGGLRLLWQNTLKFHLEVLSKSDRFIHCLIKDSVKNFE